MGGCPAVVSTGVLRVSRASVILVSVVEGSTINDCIKVIHIDTVKVIVEVESGDISTSGEGNHISNKANLEGAIKDKNSIPAG